MGNEVILTNYFTRIAPVKKTFCYIDAPFEPHHLLVSVMCCLVDSCLKVICNQDHCFPLGSLFLMPEDT
jgi:hypothetical protein